MCIYCWAHPQLTCLVWSYNFKLHFLRQSALFWTPHSPYCKFTHIFSALHRWKRRKIGFPSSPWVWNFSNTYNPETLTIPLIHIPKIDRRNPLYTSFAIYPYNAIYYFALSSSPIYNVARSTLKKKYPLVQIVQISNFFSPGFRHNAANLDGIRWIPHNSWRSRHFSKK